MANGLDMSPEELARLLEEVERYRGRPLPPPPPGWTPAAWLRFLASRLGPYGALGLLAFSIWFLVKRSRGAYHDKYDVAPLPQGGPPCSADSPAAQRLAQVTWHASGWSFSGETPAFEDALADAKAKARRQGAGVCGGECGAGATCQGVPAVQDVRYTSWTQLWLATRCNLTFTVHCECV